MVTRKKNHIQLKDLEVYRLSRELSKGGWEIYEKLSWQDKKIVGDQFIESIDSVGANIAEGYGRFHYLDRIKFYYNSRGSLNEAIEHWLELLFKRNKIDKKKYAQMRSIASKLSIKLNNFIASVYKTKKIKQR